MNIFLWENFNEIKSKRLEILNNPIRKKFCAGVISKCEHKFRLNFINKLNNYKKVDMGGRCYNNMNGRVIDKIKFFNEYKFSIAMENSEGDGMRVKKLLIHLEEELYLYIMEIILLMNIKKKKHIY